MKRSERPPMKSPAAVGELLGELLSRQGLEEKFEEYRVWLVWEACVGPQIAANATPLRLRDGVLEVRVSQPVWMQQLQLLKPQLLAKLNRQLDGAPLKDLYLKRGALKPTAGSDDSPGIPWRQVRLDETERAAIQAALEPLDDSELRNPLQRLMEKQRQLTRARNEKAGQDNTTK